MVEAAPQARPKTTAVANTALRPSPCSPPSFNALPVPLLRQVSQNSCFTCMGALFRSNMGRHLLQTPFCDHFWLHFGIILESINVVEAAPQARLKTTAVANTALRPSPCRPPSFNALPVPMLRQVSQNSYVAVLLHWSSFWEYFQSLLTMA